MKDKELIQKLKKLSRGLKDYTIEFRKKQTKVKIESIEIKTKIETLIKKGYLLGNNRRSEKLISERVAFINLLDTKIEPNYRYSSYVRAMGISLNTVKKYALSVPKDEIYKKFEEILF